MAQDKQVRRNEEITASQVRVVTVDGEQAGIMTIEAAVAAAYEQSMDLVEVAPNSEPPVCRIMDYGRFVFEQNKKQHASRRKQKQMQVKEIKFRPGTEEADYQIKLKRLLKFLEDGDKTKVSLRFRGREMLHQDLGRQLLARVREDLDEVATVEQMPRLEGRQMVMMLAPKRGKA
ncbi:MAG: translation initiation factor IF-3 [Gammaproteobacteria bacterium]